MAWLQQLAARHTHTHTQTHFQVQGQEKGLSENASKLGPIFDTSEGAKSFKSVVNSSRFHGRLFSTSGRHGFHFGVVLEVKIVATPFFEGLQKTTKNIVDFQSILGAKTRSKIVHFLTFFRNRVLEGPRIDFGSILDRILIDLGVIFRRNSYEIQTKM